MNTAPSFLRPLAAVAILAAAGPVLATTEAPVEATLLPAVSVTADVARPHAPPRVEVAATAPLRVTLLPTVRVTAAPEDVAAVTLPVVRVSARAEAAAPRAEATAYRPREEGGLSRAPRLDDGADGGRELPLLRARAMP